MSSAAAFTSLSLGERGRERSCSAGSYSAEQSRMSEGMSMSTGPRLPLSARANALRTAGAISDALFTMMPYLVTGMDTSKMSTS